MEPVEKSTDTILGDSQSKNKQTNKQTNKQKQTKKPRQNGASSLETVSLPIKDWMAMKKQTEKNYVTTVEEFEKTATRQI